MVCRSAQSIHSQSHLKQQIVMNGLRTHTNLDPSRVINDFVASLADPCQPLHCTSFLYGCLIALNRKELGAANSQILRTQHHDLYNACMALLTTPRPHGDFEDAGSGTWDLREDKKEALETCHCDTKDTFVQQIHVVSDSARHNKGEPCPYSELGYMLFVVINNALQCARDESIHEVSHNATDATRAGGQVMWPTKPHDLLPYGAKASIEALISWVGITHNPISLGTLGSMLEICKLQIVPHIAGSETLANYLVNITEVVRMVWIAQQQAPESTDVTPTFCLDDLKRITFFCHMFVDLCHEKELQKFVVGSVEKILWMGDIVLKWLPELQASIQPLSSSAKHDIEYTRTYYIALCSLVHRYFEKAFDSTKYHPLIVSHSLWRMTQKENPVEMTFEGFLRLAGDQRCCAPGCLETFSSAGRKFNNCAGCKLILYCSKPCQTRAWKHTTVPHKSICKKMGTLVELTSLPSKLTDPIGGMAFAQAFKAKGIDEVIAADVAIHLKKLLEMSAATCTLDFLPLNLKLTGMLISAPKIR